MGTDEIKSADGELRRKNKGENLKQDFRQQNAAAPLSLPTSAGIFLFLGAELFSPESENIDQKDQETARSDCQKCGPNFGGYGLLRPNRLDEILRIFKKAVYIYNLVHASMGFLVVVRKAVPLPLGCQLERFRLARTGDNAKSIS